MGELLTPVHLMVVAIVAFALFGGKKLPRGDAATSAVARF
jgi:Sec-independent protein translocase protein TatA